MTWDQVLKVGGSLKAVRGRRDSLAKKTPGDTMLGYHTVMPDIALHERMSNFLTILQLQNLIVIALLLGNLVVCRRSADLEQLLRRTKDAIRLLDGSAERLEERLFGTGRAEGSRRRGS